LATKAQLEAELAKLKQQLAKRETPAEAELSGRPEGDAATEAEAPTTDWDAQIRDVLEELEDLPHSKPLVFALGAFALGYLIGRSK